MDVKPQEAVAILPIWIVIASVIGILVSLMSTIVQSTILGIVTLPFQAFLHLVGFLLSLSVAFGLYIKGTMGKIAYLIAGAMAFFGLLINLFIIIFGFSIAVTIGLLTNAVTLSLIWFSREVYL